MKAKISFGILLLFFHVLHLFGQKPVIDTAALNHWGTYVGETKMTHDGKYLSYSIVNKSEPKLTFIQSADGAWKTEYINASTPEFTNDSKMAVLMIGDSLVIQYLGSEKKETISNIEQYHLSASVFGEWIYYTLHNGKNTGRLRNLITGTEKIFNSVSTYLFSPNGKYLLTEENSSNGSCLKTVSLINIPARTSKTIWSSKDSTQSVSKFSFDTSGNQLCFFLQEHRGSRLRYQLCYYETTNDSAFILLNNSSPELPDGLTLSDAQCRFSKDGRHLFFSLALKDFHQPNDEKSIVDVWSYLDPALQSEQKIGQQNYNPFYAAVLNLKTHRVTRLEWDDERIFTENGDYVITQKGLHGILMDLEEYYWNKMAQYSFFVTSCETGEKRLINKDVSSYPNLRHTISPDSKWIIYFDYPKKRFASFEINTGFTRYICDESDRWLKKENAYPEPVLSRYNSVWMNTDKGEMLLVSDNYDIWQLDPSGQKAPMNLTNGYGLKHLIKFFLETSIQNQLYAGSKILLNAFDLTNKKMGFYSKILGSKGDPKMLSMTFFSFGDWDGEDGYLTSSVAAFGGDKYMVMRQSATEYPNYFITENFQSFKPLTNVQPQRQYNWLTAELVHWKNFEGKTCTAILYKPENFDSTKKYPVIFDYYEIRSNGLNQFIFPAVSYGRINIPWFTSRGYIVCVPDIQYEIGKSRQSACSTVLSLAKYLASKDWIDAAKMGLQGHSFGGDLTDYIISHTYFFAAACSASGTCDLISSYGDAARGSYAIYWAEKGQGREVAAPWQVPDLYIANSPIFQVGKVHTPLLMMNNVNDNNVPFHQGLEFFTSLRRSGKRVWMLSYKHGTHSLGGVEALDYTIRMTQFFDHYLKDSACPKWMLYGIPARTKGIDDGLGQVREKDPKTGKWLTPPEGGLLTPEEKKKVETLKKRKPITVTIE